MGGSEVERGRGGGEPPLALGVQEGAMRWARGHASPGQGCVQGPEEASQRAGDTLKITFPQVKGRQRVCFLLSQRESTGCGLNCVPKKDTPKF